MGRAMISELDTAVGAVGRIGRVRFRCCTLIISPKLGSGEGPVWLGYWLVVIVHNNRSGRSLSCAQEYGKSPERPWRDGRKWDEHVAARVCWAHPGNLAPCSRRGRFTADLRNHNVQLVGRGDFVMPRGRFGNERQPSPGDAEAVCRHYSGPRGGPPGVATGTVGECTPKTRPAGSLFRSAQRAGNAGPGAAGHWTDRLGPNMATSSGVIRGRKLRLTNFAGRPPKEAGRRFLEPLAAARKTSPRAPTARSAGTPSGGRSPGGKGGRGLIGHVAADRQERPSENPNLSNSRHSEGVSTIAPPVPAISSALILSSGRRAPAQEKAGPAMNRRVTDLDGKDQRARTAMARSRGRLWQSGSDLQRPRNGAMGQPPCPWPLRFGAG